MWPSLPFERVVKAFFNLGPCDAAVVAKAIEAFHHDARVLEAHLAKHPYLAGRLAEARSEFEAAAKLTRNVREAAFLLARADKAQPSSSCRARGGEKRFTETDGDMIVRVGKELMGRKNIIVLNDEALMGRKNIIADKS